MNNAVGLKHRRGWNATFLAFTGALAGFFQTASVAASFDCAQATTAVEALICNDPSLSSLDDEMAEAYRIKLSDVADEERPALVGSQRAWLRQRNSCADARCIAARLRERTAELTGVPLPAATPIARRPTVQSVETNPPDTTAGSVVFARTCADCHNVGEFSGQDPNALAASLRSSLTRSHPHRTKLRLSEQSIVDVTFFAANYSALEDEPADVPQETPPAADDTGQDTPPIRAWVGIEVKNYTNGLEGVAVEAVTPGGPAARAGVRPGFRILRFNDNDVSDTEDFWLILAYVEPGEPITLATTDHTYTLTAGSLEDAAAAATAVNSEPTPEIDTSQPVDMLQAVPPAPDPGSQGSETAATDEQPSSLSASMIGIGVAALLVIGAIVFWLRSRSRDDDDSVDERVTPRAPEPPAMPPPLPQRPAVVITAPPTPALSALWPAPKPPPPSPGAASQRAGRS